MLTLLFLAILGLEKGVAQTSPFVPEKKVIIHSPVEIQKGNHLVRLALENLRESVLPKGTFLNLLVDERCVLNQGPSLGGSTEYPRLTALLDPKLFHVGDKKSTVESHRIELPFSASLLELESLAQKENCLVGLSQAGHAKHTSLPNDPYYPKQKQHQIIHSEKAWDFFFHSTDGIKEDVVIAVIDDGIDLRHQDLQGQIWVNRNEIPANGLDDDHNGYVDDVNGFNFVDNLPDPSPQIEESGTIADHGTHVAGLAAAASNNGVGVAGVMGYHAKLMALNVFGKSLDSDFTHVEKAIRYAADNGAKIVNLSLGGEGRFESVGDALAYATSRGVTVFVAAGNDGADLAKNVQTPPCFGTQRGVIVVGSIDAVTGMRSSFSNFNSTLVKIGAPGSNGILSTTPNNKYEFMDGTSMATPIAAAAGALAYGYMKAKLGREPKLHSVENVLLQSGRPVPGLSLDFHEGRILDLEGLARFIQTH